MKNLHLTLFGVGCCVANLAVSTPAQECRCGLAQAEEAPMEQKTPDRVITEAERDQTVALRVGEVLGVRLEAKPTTGFEWIVAYTNAEILPQSGAARFEVNNGDEGASTQQILAFEAKKSGKVALELHYKRPWEKEKAPAQIFKVTVEIAENSQP